MKRFFTFDPESQFCERIVNQATKTEIFDEVVSYTDMDLQCMSDFWDVHGEFVENNPIMYGYGIWKPYLVMKEFEGLNDGDILFYADPGCEFDLDCENPKEEFEKIVENLKDHKFIATNSPNSPNSITDKNMTKMDTVKHMEMEDHPGYLTEQIQATTFVLEKCERTSKFVKEWYEICCNGNYHFINDDESVSPNNPTDYDDHRHEQSVLSLLLKKREFYPLPNNQITIESVICLSSNLSGTHYPACRVTGSSLYSLHFGDEFIEGNQIVQMSNLIRKYKPQTILETGFGSGRTAATMIQSCRTLPILNYVNVDKNYSLYNPISSNFRKHCHDLCPAFKSFERRSSDLLRNEFMEEEFPEGIDWFTVDGDPTYPGCLYELVSGLQHMKKGGIIYVVADRGKRKNVDIKDACDFFLEIYKTRLIRMLDDVVGKEICYFVVV